jgi:hypothetical protein
MGHAGETMSDRYHKIKEYLPFREKWAEQCGFGFELPLVVPREPIVPRNYGKASAEKVA